MCMYSMSTVESRNKAPQYCNCFWGHLEYEFLPWGQWIPNGSMKVILRVTRICFDIRKG